MLRPALPWALARCVRAMQRDIDDILDLEHVVSTAFRPASCGSDDSREILGGETMKHRHRSPR
jgi:hypothetical protein